MTRNACNGMTFLLFVGTRNKIYKCQKHSYSRRQLIISTVMDVTERKRAELALEMSNKNYGTH